MKRTFFFEFEHKERKQLIAEMVRYDPRLADLPRANLFLLWFSDIESFRSLQVSRLSLLLTGGIGRWHAQS